MFYLASTAVTGKEGEAALTAEQSMKTTHLSLPQSTSEGTFLSFLPFPSPFLLLQVYTEPILMDRH